MARLLLVESSRTHQSHNRPNEAGRELSGTSQDMPKAIFQVGRPKRESIVDQSPAIGSRACEQHGIRHFTEHDSKGKGWGWQQRWPVEHLP